MNDNKNANAYQQNSDTICADTDISTKGQYQWVDILVKLYLKLLKTAIECFMVKQTKSESYAQVNNTPEFNFGTWMNLLVELYYIVEPGIV